MSLTELRRKNTPLRDVIESLFRANYDLSPKTERWYRQHLRDFTRFLERSTGREPRLSDVTKGGADASLKERSTVPTTKYAKGSPFAARATAATLKRFANWLAQEGILADSLGASVLKNVRRGKVDDDVRQPLTDEEVGRAIDAAGAISVVARAACVLGLGSGLRLNELREARVGDLDLRRGEFTVRPETSKFGKGRVVSLHPEVIRAMDRYLRDRLASRQPEAPLFPTRSGTTLTSDGFPKVFDRIRHRPGLHDFSAHLLRHTWATNFMRVPNASLLELKRQGGWERWEMVERYSHAVPMEDRRRVPNPLAAHRTAPHIRAVRVGPDSRAIWLYRGRLQDRSVWMPDSWSSKTGAFVGLVLLAAALAFETAFHEVSPEDRIRKEAQGTWI